MKSVSCEQCENAIITRDSFKCGSIDSKCQDYFRKHGKQAAENGCNGFRHLMVKDYRLVTNDRAFSFMLAGKSEFKIKSGKTGREIHYKLIQKPGITYMEEIDKKPHYLYWIYTGVNENNLEFAGTIYLDREASLFRFSRGINGKCSKHDVSIQAILYVLNHLVLGKYTINVEIYHNGFCGRCGRKLTKFQDITSGIESMCFHHLDIPKVRNNNC